jgi:hypothetical protein
MIQVIDGLFSEEEILMTEKMFLSKLFPYYYSPWSLPKDKDFYHPALLKKLEQDPNYMDRFEDRPFFIHPIVEEQEVMCNTVVLIEDMLQRLQLKNKILRSRVNYVYEGTSEKPSVPHIDDFYFDHFIMIHYIMDSDGPTVIYDNDLNIIEQVEPKAGRVLLLGGGILHSSTPPVKNNKRLVTNTNLLI